MEKIKIVNNNEIHKAIWKWLFEGNNGISELSFISAQYDENGAIISDSRVIYTPITIGSSQLIKSYMRHQELQYDFMLKQYAPISSQSNTPANIRVLEVFENLAIWCQEQINKGNVPMLPNNCTLKEVIVNDGTVAGQDDKGAEFQIILNIKYINERRI